MSEGYNSKKKSNTRILAGIVGFSIIVIVAALILGGRNVGQSGSVSGEGIKVGTSVGETAPDFEASTLEGDTLRLNDLRGQVVVVNLFASWCGPCRLETPHLVKAFQALEGEGVVFVGLNLNEATDTVAAFQDEFGIPYPLVLDEDGKLTSEVYKPIGLPTTWFIDQEGVVRYIFSGAMTEELLIDILSDVRAGRQPDPFSQTG